MHELMQQSSLLAPTFESSRSPDRFVVTFLFHHFLGQDDLRWLGALVHGKLGDEEARALVFVPEVGAIGNTAYRSINRVDTLMASQHLRRLRNAGLLEMKGRGNRTYYVPTALILDSLAAENAPATEENTPAFGENAPATEENAPAEIQLQRLLTSMPTDLRVKLPESGSRRLRDAALRELIQELCGWQPLTARELTALLRRRSAKYLVRKTLSPMLAAGLLAYTISEMENHPAQHYTLSAAQTDDE